MKWITRERVKVDRVACPWLIRKFVDKDAEFLFVPRDQVMEIAAREESLQDYARCLRKDQALYDLIDGLSACIQT